MTASKIVSGNTILGVSGSNKGYDAGKKDGEPSLIYLIANKVDDNTVSIDFSHIEGYKNLTKNDILVCIYPGNGYASNAGAYTSNQTYTYNNSTGIMTIVSDELARGYNSVGYGLLVPVMIKPDYTGTATFVSGSDLIGQFDLTSVRDYDKLTAHNIILQFSKVTRYSSKNGNTMGIFEGQEYNPSTGILKYKIYSTGIERTSATNLGTITVGVKM